MSVWKSQSIFDTHAHPFVNHFILFPPILSLIPSIFFSPFAGVPVGVWCPLSTVGNPLPFLGKQGLVGRLVLTSIVRVILV